MCPRKSQYRLTTSTSPTSSTSNLAYHRNCSMNPSDTGNSNPNLFYTHDSSQYANASANANLDSFSSNSLQHVHNPSMMMLLHPQPNQQAPLQQQPEVATFASNNDPSLPGQQDVSSIVSGIPDDISNDANNGMLPQQLPPTAMMQAFQDHQLHPHGGGMAFPNGNSSSNISSSDNNFMLPTQQNSMNNFDANQQQMQQQQQQMQQQQMQMQTMASMMPAIPPEVAQQLLVQLQQKGPGVLPSIALLNGSLGNNNVTQQQSQPAAAASSFPPRPRKVGRRGDPRMHEAVRYRLAHPKCTLLDALIHGGFSFPPLHLANISDRFLKDASGVTLSQRKNQLMRRLRVIEKERATDDGDKKKKTSSKRKSSKQKAKSSDDSAKSSDDDDSTNSKGGDDEDGTSKASQGDVAVTMDVPVVPSSSSFVQPQQVLATVDAATAMPGWSASIFSSEQQGQGSELEQQIHNQLLINQLKMVLLQQQIQDQAQGQEQAQEQVQAGGEQQQQQQQQQQMNANEILMSLQTDPPSPSQGQERFAIERNAKSA